MTGAIAAGWARGLPLRDALMLGAAAGAGNFLRHGLGTGHREVVEQLLRHVVTRPIENGHTGSAPSTSAEGAMRATHSR